jgi:uncharacterized protein YndB with AHSA1/START domain
MSETSTITMTRQVPVGPERAFRAWVDPVELARWWWPQWPDTTYDLDPREGGTYRIHSAAVGVGVTGTFTTLTRPSLLGMTWIWFDDSTPGEGHDAPVIDEVEVTFAPNDQGTEVTVRHTSSAHTPEGGVEQGWNDCLDRLPDHLGADT